MIQKFWQPPCPLPPGKDPKSCWPPMPGEGAPIFGAEPEAIAAAALAEKKSKNVHF